MSIPQTANGQVIGIVLKVVAGKWLAMAESWHPMHLVTNSFVSAFVVS